MGNGRLPGWPFPFTRNGWKGTSPMAKLGLFAAQCGIVMVCLAAIAAWPVTLALGIIAATVGLVVFLWKV